MQAHAPPLQMLLSQSLSLLHGCALHVLGAAPTQVEPLSRQSSEVAQGAGAQVPIAPGLLHVAVNPQSESVAQVPLGSASAAGGHVEVREAYAAAGLDAGVTCRERRVERKIDGSPGAESS